MVSGRSVSNQDINLLEQHVLDYSNDIRFEGYRSKPKELVDRLQAAEQKVRGLGLNEVLMSVERQEEIINVKKEALFNILSQNDDAKYFIDNQVIESYIGKMMDDYAVSDILRDNVHSMMYDFQPTYHRETDPDLMYITYNFKEGDENDRNVMAINVDSQEEAVEYIAGIYEDIDSENLEFVDSNELAYTKNKPYTSIDGAVVGSGAQQAFFRGRYVGDVVQPDAGVEHSDPKSFIRVDTGWEESFGRDGVYKVEDNELYQYNGSQQNRRQISGEGGLWEAEKQTTDSKVLGWSREAFFTNIKDELEQETGRSFDLDNLEKSLSDRYVAPKIKFTAVEKELEDELEL